MEEQMGLFGADVLPETTATPKRCQYDMASDLVADYARQAAAQLDEVTLRTALHGYVSGVCDSLGLVEHQRACLRAEAWNCVEECRLLRAATGN